MGSNSNFLKKVVFLFCASLPSILFSQEISYSMGDDQGVPLDQKLIELLNFRNGIFIEAGAYDGVTQSNTKRLEKYYGWKGILVEPSKSLYASLCENRPSSRCYSCALGSFDQNNTYVQGDFDGMLMSSLNGSRMHRVISQTVLMRSLQSILDEVNIQHVDFFSLDVEGYELNVLKGVDFDRTTFKYLLIEVYSDQFDEIVNFLSQKGYVLLENFSNYNKVACPNWDGTHNDYLFGRKALN